MVHGRILVRTTGQGFVDLSEAFRRFLAENRVQHGLATLFVTHTTCSLTVQENADDDVQLDLLTSLDKLAPEAADYRHHLEGADDMPGHIKAMLSDTSVTVPVADGRAQLGIWQAIYLIEHRARGRERTVALTFIGT
ncbi:YjbQ family protein [Acuticoccus sp. 2012]|uniref:YjbQ family protein n=1 Tax=Acuticoccus mangrovi TaxID=2796142 RepID=A0A934MKJ6_9HYPH|nr:YjbQ family protein [Acuticoccus mangrovi]